VEHDLAAAQAELRRRARRVGRAYLAGSPIVGAFAALLSRPTWGAFLGGIMFAVGLYAFFALAPFAAWIRRRELR
jgi:hypothetical protein